jgi:hypothetical protein
VYLPFRSSLAELSSEFQALLDTFHVPPLRQIQGLLDLIDFGLLKLRFDYRFHIALFAYISIVFSHHGSPFVLEINVGSFERKFALNQPPIADTEPVLLR